MTNCDRCSTLLPAEAQYCPRCGKRLFIPPAVSSERLTWEEFVALEKTGEEASTLYCPRCHHLMTLVHLAGIDVDSCSYCAGCWLEPSEIQEAFQRYSERRVESIGQKVFESVRRFPLAETDAEYLKCPRCRDRMLHYNFEEYSGIMLHRCGKCGFWLDAGVFVKIYEYLASGGHEYYLRRKFEEQEQEHVRWGGGGRQRP